MSSGFCPSVFVLLFPYVIFNSDKPARTFCLKFPPVSVIYVASFRENQCKLVETLQTSVKAHVLACHAYSYGMVICNLRSLFIGFICFLCISDFKIAGFGLFFI